MSNAEITTLLNEFGRKTEFLISTSDADEATRKLLTDILSELSDLIEGITNSQ